MQLIYSNPYRILGILVGATAREKERQVRRLKQFIEAEQEPEADFSFLAMGGIVRTVDNVTESASKLNLDSDKITASLFWFYNGNPITDEPAFDALDDGDSETAIRIWRKLVYDVDDLHNLVTKRNASAFHNLSTIYLHEYGIDKDTLQLKMLFLESEYFNELKILATDETFKISQKEIQLLYLNSLLDEKVSNVIDAVSDIEFLAKEDFMKGFVQKPIEQLEKQIDETRKKQKLILPKQENTEMNYIKLQSHF